MKKSRQKTKTKDKPYTHELSLLPAKALIAIKGFLDYGIDDNARRYLERILKEYKTHKDDVKNSLLLAIKFCKGKHEADLIQKVKTEINQIAKSVW
jgi:hypothetical protein